MWTFDVDYVQPLAMLPDFIPSYMINVKVHISSFIQYESFVKLADGPEVVFAIGIQCINKT